MAREIYEKYTDRIEPFGLDESWLDVTGSVGLFGSAMRIAEEISERIKFELGITASIGVSDNKITAKMGSDYKKPDAITRIERDNYKELVYPLPAADLLCWPCHRAQAAQCWDIYHWAACRGVAEAFGIQAGENGAGAAHFRQRA